MIRKIRRILLCLAIAVLSLFGAIACAPAELSIVLVDEYDREECVLNREYDITKALENYTASWDYQITECFYVDNFDDMRRHDIPVVDDTKFTPTAPYDVHVVLVVKRGSQTLEREFVLKVVIPQTDMQARMLTSWSQEGVSKRMEGKKDYVLDGEESSVKVTYLGEDNPAVNNGVNIGSFVCDSEDASKTSWDNAVMTFSVYNPQDYDLQIGWLATVGGRTQYKGIGHMQDRTVLKAGEWTKIDWSLRAVGLNWDITDELVIYLKLRIKDTTDMVKPYNYTVYFCDVDIADYSEEEFPELETRTEAEIWADANGDTADKWLCGNYTNETTKLQTAYGTELTARVKEYADEETKAVNDSTSYIEYTMKASTRHSGTYYGNFLRFMTSPTAATSMPISNEFYETVKDINWNNAYITFWAYNDNETGTCGLYGMNGNAAGALITTLPYGKWTKVEVPLRSYCGVTENPFGGDTYDVKLFVAYSKTGCHDWDTYENFASRLLIDGLTIEGRYAGDNLWLTEHYTQLGTKVSKYWPTMLTAQEQEAGVSELVLPVDEESYVAYTLKATGPVSAGNYSGQFLNFDAARPISGALLSKYEDLDWGDASIRFWVYNDTDYKMNLSGGTEGWKQSVPSREWTEVKLSLNRNFGLTKAVLDAGTYNISLNAQFAETGLNTAETCSEFEGLLYLAGFEFINLTVEDQLLDSYTANAGTNNKDGTKASNINRSYVGELSASTKDFDTEFTAPEGVTTAKYVDYTVSSSVGHSKGSYVVNFLNFSAYTETMNTRKTSAMPVNILERYTAIAQEDVYVRFYIYNNTGLSVKLSGTQPSAGVDYSQSNTEKSGALIKELDSTKAWTEIKIALSDLSTEAGQLDIAGGNYNIKLWLSFTDPEAAKTGDDATNTYDGTEKWNFYMTGFEFTTLTEAERAEIENAKLDAANTLTNEQIKNNLVSVTNKFNLYLAGMNLTAEVKNFEGAVSAPTGTAYSTYLGYTLQATNVNTSKNTAYAGFINFSASNTGYAISSSQIAMPTALINKYGSDFDWANASVSFWIYNDSDATATLVGTKYYDNSEAAATTKTDGVGSAITTVAIGNKAWTKVTLKLSDFTSQYDVANGNYKIQLGLTYDCTAVTADNYADYSWSFYMTGFEFVEGTTQA